MDQSHDVKNVELRSYFLERLALSNSAIRQRKSRNLLFYMIFLLIVFFTFHAMA